MATLPNRYLSIDVLRGMTLALMIVVNMSISDELSYAQLLHSVWHGLTLTDIVFPSFLFAVGASMAFSLERYQRQGEAYFLGRVAKRGAMIFFCGWVVSNFPFFSIGEHGGFSWVAASDLRILGVLQRIALTYCLAALLLHYAGLRAALIYSVAVLLGYWWLLASFGDYSLAGNVALKVDLSLFGASHLYKGEGIPFDPEGLLGTLPATVNVLAGYAIMRTLRQRPSGQKTVVWFVAAGLGLIALSLAWNVYLPINKKIWTSSYVLCTIGIDLLALALLVEFIDIRGWRRPTRYFETFGKNTLAIYLFAEILMSVAWTVKIGDQALFMWIYTHGFQWAGAKSGSLLMALAFMHLCWMVANLMDKKRIFIRL